MTVLAPSAVPSTTAGIPFASELAQFGDRPALLTDDRAITYRELAERVADFADRLGAERRLILLAGSNTVAALVTYLGALAAGHPVLLAPGDRPDAVDSLIRSYDPDVLVCGSGELVERRAVSAHELHPDLALLLSTSGSTGSAKLVRLSGDNLQANAATIASYLQLTSEDRGITTLPMHYCYGLSVINSHLLRGAGLIVTDRSVSDPEFWEVFRAGRATSLAGVPYTFDLLDRVGFAAMRLPSLRYVTQAGGRLDPERVRRYAALGRRDGWELFVMYGQTEATARMAYLPPHLAETHPHCIGGPVPGGSFRLSGEGELIYSGPNVMLGYAESPSDLSRGRTGTELHTGDLARRTADGLYEIVGRKSRFVKPFGLRVDLGSLERRIAGAGFTAACTGDDSGLVIAVAGAEPERVQQLATAETGLPARIIRVHRVAALPRLASGKPDYPAIAAVQAPARPGAAAESTDLPALYRRVLGVGDVTAEDTFTGLGGDSLSYAEMSVRLEQALGRLPSHWPTMSIRELTGRPAQPRARRWRTLDTSVALRAIAIVLIVGTHAALFNISGGAHLLLGVAGYNFARFQLTPVAHGQRLRRIARSIGRIAGPAMLWIALMFLLTDSYTLVNVLLVDYLVTPIGSHNDFWFIEALVYLMLAALALLALPLVDRVERRFPFGLPVALAGFGLVTRYEVIPGRITPVIVLWLFALGWAIAKATTKWQRAAVSLAVVATVPGFFSNPSREAIVMAGLILLIWAPVLPSLRLVSTIAGVLATSSLFIYLTHWQVFPPLAGYSPLVAVVASLVAGVAGQALAARLLTAARRVASAKIAPRLHRAEISPRLLGAKIAPFRGNRGLRAARYRHLLEKPRS